ncbi:three-Cys-motif partner protein TcmP [Nonomuraea rubra]|uniref:three-Cys-motif partner protein TcmP n=1 Tax=Nonomuraea rubra TaxID=46180 RepID=UPI0033D5FCE4
MAKGTASGLLEDRDGNAQSVFKHEILSQYLEPFLSMVGSTAKGRRLVVLDGFAGRGRYPDGTPASAERILQAMLRLRRIRDVSAFFVEKQPDDFQELAAVVEEYATRGVHAAALEGKVEQHLEKVLDSAGGIPLFLFLDPTGAGLSFKQLAMVLTGRRQGKKPVTEVLLNFSADLSRRVVGALKSGRTNQRVMDGVCGGTWWRELAEQAVGTTSGAGSFEAVADAVVHEYARRLAHETEMTSVCIPIRRRMEHQPIYHLVFFTRSPYGLWVFADAVGKARQAWIRHLDKLQEDKMGPSLITVEGMFLDTEASAARATVTGNLRRLLAQHPGLTLVSRPLEVFGTAYGVATEQVVAEAMRQMVAAGEAEVSWHQSFRKSCIRRPRGR